MTISTVSSFLVREIADLMVMGLCETEVLWVVGKEREKGFAGRKWVREGGGFEEGKERRPVASMVVLED